MPKHKKKLKCEKEVDMNSANEDDNLSVISSTATSSVYQNDLNNSPEPNHDDNVRDSIETKLDVSIEGIQEKGFKEREEALKNLIDLFKKHWLNTYILEKKFTLTESLLKCLKRGKLNEQLLALKTMMLTFVQFGYTETSEELLRLIYETLVSFIKNEQLDAELRGQCMKTLSLGLYTTIQMDEMKNLMIILQELYNNADKALNKMHSLSSFYSSVLSSWSLMITIMPINYVNDILISSLEKFELLLENTGDVDFRICIGESIALLYELTGTRRDLNSNLRKFDSSNLTLLINDLVKESSKSTSKKDRRTQHSNFRDILKTIEDYNKKIESSDLGSDYDDEQMNQLSSANREFVKVANQHLYLDNWIRKKQYKAFSELLGTGMNNHLLENEFLRDIFELGPPVAVLDRNEKQQKLSKMQRVNRNKEEFRYRTKDMNKRRGNKETNNDVDISEDLS